MKLIGVTGGIGTGKTTVCKIVEAMGFPVYYADLRAKILQENDSEIVRETIQLLGNDAYLNGQLNRSFIASKIFNDPALRNKLNSIVHPRVRADFESWLHEQKAPCVFQESALIYEINRQDLYDKVILVTAPEEIRVNRVVNRDSSTYNEVQARIKAQMSDDEKRQYEPVEIINDGSQSLIKQLLNFLTEYGCYSTSS